MDRCYKNMQIWDLSYHLILECYKLIENLPESENDNIKDQLRRAATSIPLNIAEGSGAASNRVFFQHLVYAFQSAKEVDAIIQLCHGLEFCSDEQFQDLSFLSDKLCSKLYKFSQNIEKRCSFSRFHGNQGYKRK